MGKLRCPECGTVFDSNLLECPECGEFVVRIDEYDPNATYYCPECGEEIDLSKQYEEVVPEIKKYRL